MSTTETVSTSTVKLAFRKGLCQSCPVFEFEIVIQQYAVAPHHLTASLDVEPPLQRTTSLDTEQRTTGIDGATSEIRLELAEESKGKPDVSGWRESAAVSSNHQLVLE
jgi:hypothetical protein